MPIGEAPAGEASASHGTTSPAHATATPILSECLPISASSAIRPSPLTHSRHSGERRQYARISQNWVVYAFKADRVLLQDIPDRVSQDIADSVAGVAGGPEGAGGGSLPGCRRPGLSSPPSPLR